MRTTRVELTSKFLFYALAAVVVMLIGWELRSVIGNIAGILFIAFILSAGLRPIVDNVSEWRLGAPVRAAAWFLDVLFSPFDYWFNRKYQGKNLDFISNRLDRWQIGRPLASILIYLGLLIILGFIVLVMTNEVINQVVNLIDALPRIFNKIAEFINTSIPVVADLIPLEVLQNELGTFVSSVLGSNLVKELVTGQNVLTVLNQTVGVFNSVAELLISFVTVLIVSVYMLQSKDPVYEGVLSLLPDKRASSLRRVFKKIETSLGSWLVGQLSLMVIIGVVTYFLLTIPGLFDPNYTLDDFALPIALMAGLLEAIPNVGPAITLVLTSALAIGTNGIGTVVYVAVSFTVLQNLEAAFIVPMIMKRAIGIDPILSILGIIGGFQIAGVVGAILAIPLIGITQIMVVAAANEYKRLERQRPKLVE